MIEFATLITLYAKSRQKSRLFLYFQRAKSLIRRKIFKSKKVLTDNLRALEEKGLIHREVFAEVPPRVEYSLTELGKTLKPIPDATSEWATNTKNGIEYKKEAAHCGVCDFFKFVNNFRPKVLRKLANGITEKKKSRR